MKRRAALILVLSAAWFSACDRPNTPVDAAWGKQPCSECGMTVSEPRHSAQLITAGGDRRFFDDIGCMVKHLESQAPDAKLVWVRDGDRWVPANEARFQAGAKTPMNYGFATSSSGTLDFSAVKKAVLEKKREH